MTFKATDKFVLERLTFWTKKLNVKKDFNWTSNFKKWNNLFRTHNLRLEKCLLPFGAVMIPKAPLAPVMFINKTRNNSKKEMEKTIVHELLHIKFPLKSEKQIRIETSRIIK